MREALASAAETAVRDCLGLRADETCLVLSDEGRESIGRALWEAARLIAREAFFVLMRERSRPGEEPPDGIAALMRTVDVVVAPTTMSLTHTNARRAACAAGARVATLPGITDTTMVRCLNADVHAIAARTELVAARLRGATRVRVCTAAGTDIRFSIEGVPVLASTGLVLNPGGFGNLPSGEAYLRPREGTAEGTVVVDASMCGIGDLAGVEPIRWTVKDGRVVDIQGGENAAALARILDAVGPDARVLAEFGVGTNDAARVVGNILEDEKVLGTVHFAVGNNVSMGGTNDVPVHLDGVLFEPDVWLDDTLFQHKGQLIL